MNNKAQLPPGTKRVPVLTIAVNIEHTESFFKVGDLFLR
jgi:hypothetical protein